MKQHTLRRGYEFSATIRAFCAGQDRSRGAFAHGDGEAAHRIALSALNHSFEKVGDHWHAKTSKGPKTSKGGPVTARRPGGELRREVVAQDGEWCVAIASKAHLMDIARQLDVNGRSKMSKAELVGSDRQGQPE